MDPRQRLRLHHSVVDREIAARQEGVFRPRDGIELVEPTRPVLARAAQPFPTELGTLDAIHLATALLRRNGTGADLVLATHDEALGTGGRACGLVVVALGEKGSGARTPHRDLES